MGSRALFRPGKPPPGERGRAVGGRAATPGALRFGLVVGAVGVVFGDIGTSPIYTVQTVFSPRDPRPVPVSAENVYGVVSLIFWTIMIIVTITYILLAMRVDNDGEGGIMALIALLRRWISHTGRTGAILAALGIIGASLFFGDSIITPAISVLSAVEGLKIVQPSLGEAVVPITALIIVVLFVVQHRGTATVGRMFGPIMVLWFLSIALCGLRGVAKHPAILRALSPSYALGFVASQPGIAFYALAAVVLAVTGAEATYADMGHFGRRPISRAWFFLVFPALVLNYMGQGALVLDNAANVASPFFLLPPTWARGPMVLLATAATVIASQAVITGAYSVTSQAAQLGYLPRLRIVHTSRSAIGQIYVPWINWILAALVLTLVLAFRSSTALAYAYGAAVTGTITITTLLFLYVVHQRWRLPAWLLGVGGGLLLAVDLLFVAANLTKFVHGAWLPLIVALATFTVMTTWQRGRTAVTNARRQREGPLQQFLDGMHRQHPIQVPGTGVFLNRGKQTVPLALRANVERNHIRHRYVLIVSIDTEPVPWVPRLQRTSIDDLGYANDGIFHITIRTGYMQSTHVPRMLGEAYSALTDLDRSIAAGQMELENASYFLSKAELRIGGARTMARWRKHLFLATSHVTADAAEHFGLPRDRTVTVGSAIEL